MCEVHYLKVNHSYYDVGVIRLLQLIHNLLKPQELQPPQPQYHYPCTQPT